MKDPGVSSDDAVVADLRVAAKDCCVGVDDDVVADVGVALSAFDGVAVFVEGEGSCSDRYALIELDVASDGGCFADDDTGSVVDAETFLDAGAGVDVDARLGVCMLGEDACHGWCPVEIENMGEAIDKDGIEAGIAGDDFALGFSRGIAIIDGLQIGKRETFHFGKGIKISLRCCLGIPFELGILLEAVDQVALNASKQKASLLTSSIMKEGRIEGGEAFLENLKHIFAIGPDAAGLEVGVI